MSAMSSSRRSPGAASTTMRRPAGSSRSTSSAHRLDRGRVVAVVEDDLERVLVEDVHPARRLEERGVERAEPVADVLELEPHAERHRRGEHRVLHVVQRPALERRRDEVGPQQRDVGAVIVDRDHLAVDPRLEHDAAAAGADVLAHQRVGRVHRDVAQVIGRGVVGHLEAERIVGVEHGGLARHLDHDPLHLGQVLERADAAETEVVGLDVEHRAHVAVPDAHARAQQPAARDLEHRHVHVRIAQHHPGGDRAGHVARHGALAVDVDAVGGGEADVCARPASGCAPACARSWSCRWCR